MVKVLEIAILRYVDDEQDPLIIAMEQDLSQFSMFTRSSVRQVMTFFTRQVAKRTPLGDKLAVEENDYICYSKMYSNGMCVCVITDKEYPGRVAFTLASLVMKSFGEEHDVDEYSIIEKDSNLSLGFMKQYLREYQNPEAADQFMKIEKDLDDVKDVLHNTLDDLLQRGENINTLIEKSDDLSATSKTFLFKAQKQNACCSYT